MPAQQLLRLCAVPCSADGTARVYNTLTGVCTHTMIGHEGEISKVAFNPQVGGGEALDPATAGAGKGCGVTGDICIWFSTKAKGRQWSCSSY
jgi:WD40 repeat protein